MKKKIISAILTIAMILTVATGALASTNTGNSNIEFEKGSVIIIDPPTEPLDPDDPNNPDDPYNWGLDGRDIEFGKHAITPKHETYDSLNTPGLLIFSGDSEVTAFTVTVGIENFLLANNAVTMKDFELGLRPVDVAGITTNKTATVSVKDIEIGEGDAAKKILDVVTTGATDFEFYAGEWDADLFVVGGSVTTAGKATAAMTWTVVND